MKDNILLFCIIVLSGYWVTSTLMVITQALMSAISNKYFNDSTGWVRFILIFIIALLIVIYNN